MWTLGAASAVFHAFDVAIAQATMGAKKRERLSLAHASWTEYFRVKTLWLDDTIIISHRVVHGREVLEDRASESRSWVTMACLGMAGALAWRSQR
jgi:hypothetical protein